MLAYIHIYIPAPWILYGYIHLARRGTHPTPGKIHQRHRFTHRQHVGLLRVRGPGGNHKVGKQLATSLPPKNGEATMGLETMGLEKVCFLGEVHVSFCGNQAWVGQPETSEVFQKETGRTKSIHFTRCLLSVRCPSSIFLRPRLEQMSALGEDDCWRLDISWWGAMTSWILIKLVERPKNIKTQQVLSLNVHLNLKGYKL